MSDDFKIRCRAYILLALIVCLVGLALAWRWTALSAIFDVGNSVAFIRSSEIVQKPIVAIFAIVLASILAIPISLIILVSGVAYGSLLGPVYVLVGAELGAAISFSLGKFLGHDALRRLGKERIAQLSLRLAKNGLASVIFIRLVPAAPFAIVNMLAGASHIRVSDFLAGTLLGMIPGILIITLFVDQILEAFLLPGWSSYLLIIIVLLLMVLGGYAYWSRKARSRA